MKRTLLSAVLILSAATAARADIAIFVDGRTLKVDAYEAQGDTIELRLSAGGKVILPIERVERIIDDEVMPEPVVEAIQNEGLFPDRSWRFNEQSKPLFNTRYDELIWEASKKFDVDAALVSAVIKAESDYQPRIVSHKGARGLMQLMPATAKRFGVHNSFDPKANIYGGVRYLRWLLEKFEGKADLAVAAYNAGEGNVWKYNGIPPFRETINYVRRISKHFRTAEGTVVSLTRN